MASPTFLFVTRYDFATTADRLAFAFVGSDIGAEARDVETGQFYKVVASGTGAQTMSPLTKASLSKREGIPLSTLRLVSSGMDVGNIAAIGGVGASDSDPIFRGDANGSLEWSWANGAHVGALGFECPLPDDFDGSRDVTVSLDVYSGSTDAATFAVVTSWDGGAAVTDSASDTATKSATRHTITATIAAADVPDSAKTVSVLLTPPAHATNAIQLCRVALSFGQK